MELKFDQYLVRYIQNANDSILRFENTETCRVYEATLLDRNYMEYAAMGGLEFINRLVLQGLRRSGGVTVALEPASDRIKLRLTYTHTLIPKPIVCDLELMAVRRTSASEDVEVLARRVRELESAIASSAALMQRLTDLEEMSGGMVLLPGGGPPCPAHMTTVAFIGNGSKSFHSLGPLFSDTISLMGQVPGNPHQHMMPIKAPYQYCNASQYIIPYSGSMPLKSLYPIKHLKHCKTLSLVGFTDSADFSFLGAMTQLTHLYITSLIGGTVNQADCTNNDQNPILTDISWITKLTSLQTVNFFGCTKLIDISPLAKLPALKQLDIRFTGVNNTSSLTNPGLTITK
jgi:hypothetical protein